MDSASLFYHEKDGFSKVSARAFAAFLLFHLPYVQMGEYVEKMTFSEQEMRDAEARAGHLSIEDLKSTSLISSSVALRMIEKRTGVKIPVQELPPLPVEGGRWLPASTVKKWDRECQTALDAL